MTSYARSRYKNPFPNGVPQPNRSAQGWGSGWPNCQSSKMKTITAKDQSGDGHNIRVTVRGEIAEMVANLLEATDRLYDIKASSTGAYNCRPIGGTQKASNHSYGLAIDINWGDNPQSRTFHSEIPPAVVAMWIDCGWGWGGFYRSLFDTMHFEYLGGPGSVAANAAKARKYNNKTPAPPKPDPKPPVPPKPANHKPGSRTLKRGMTGSDVALVQRFIGVKDDGVFGQHTESKLKHYQGLRGLPKTGVVDDRTWKPILKSLGL